MRPAINGQPIEELSKLYDPISESDEGPWVFRIPHELVTRLAALSEGERRKLARRWSKGQEFVLEGWDKTDVARALELICGQARKGSRAKRHCFSGCVSRGIV